VSALDRLADLLREDGSVIAEHLEEPGVEPALGELAAAGERAAGAPDQYALLIEAVREGYLLHYGSPRLVRGADGDLRLLAGDYLYALGLERLAGLGDLEAVRELADLISISAQLHAEREGSGADALWLASVLAVACGPPPDHERAKRALRSGEPAAAEELRESARATAESAGLSGPWARAAQAIESAPFSEPDRG
jgi:hypothetical protein